ncbi:MAG: dihydroorotate dehydrogenase [Muribaculaceae bacterium]|nr:dihydroorotate dehydrogenase [Muribaculaceae bacterium]
MEVNDIDLSVELCGVTLQNPVIPASGCFGFGYEMNQYFPIDILGSISMKGTTLSPRFGNPLPRVAECYAGLINSVGLQNPGVDTVIAKELPKLREVFHQPIIANISGFSIEEYLECCSKIHKEPQVEFIELNVSCPNVHGGGMSFGTDPVVLGNLVKEVKKVCTIPLIVKLTPNVTDIVEMAKACVDNGANGLCVINTLLGMRIDIKTGKPVIANIMGGFSGPAIFPIALRMVYQVRQAFPTLPIIGCGGVSSASDVVEMIMAGASAVEVGSANLINPYACEEIVYELPSLLRKLNLTSIKEIKNNNK